MAGYFDYFYENAKETLKKAELPQETIYNAIQLMFGRAFIGSQALEELQNYIQNWFKKIGCVVLYDIPKVEVQYDIDGKATHKEHKKNDFMKICEKYNLDPKKREVIITEKKEILFSEDYHTKPSLYDWK